MTWSKVFVLAAVVDYGLDLVVSDVDVVWFRDPRSLISQHPDVGACLPARLCVHAMPACTYPLPVPCSLLRFAPMSERGLSRRYCRERWGGGSAPLAWYCTVPHPPARLHRTAPAPAGRCPAHHLCSTSWPARLLPVPSPHLAASLQTYPHMHMLTLHSTTCLGTHAPVHHPSILVLVLTSLVFLIPPTHSPLLNLTHPHRPDIWVGPRLLCQ